MSTRKPVLALTVGDPAGIGPEIALKAARRPEIHRQAALVLVGAARVLTHWARRLGIDVEPAPTTLAAAPRSSERVVPVYDVPNLEPDSLSVGQISAGAGGASVQYVEEAVRLARAGQVDGIVTGPINKEAMQAAGVPYPGHTEILAHLFTCRVETMFVTGPMRIFFLTRHLSLRQALDAISGDALLHLLEHAHDVLRELGTAVPRIAVAALNPHGGEHGLFGDEEQRELAPAVAAARQRGWEVSGPVPADSVFHQALQGRYDAVIALYHDQGHIAAKTYDFHGTVSVTTGLPVIRTSVDHGTAFDIAGQGIADPTNMCNAVLTCAQLTVQRWRSGRSADPAPS